MLPVIVIWLINGIYLSALAKVSVTAFWLADFCQWIIVPTALLMILARKAVLPEHYGFDRAGLDWQSLLVGAFWSFFTIAIAFFGARDLSWILLGYPNGFFSFPGVFPSGVMRHVVWLYSSATAGIVESVFFIGLPWLLYRQVRSNPSRVFFSLLAAVVFAIAHWEQGAHVVVGAFFANLVACFWFFRLGTLWPVVVGHILVDLVAFA